MNDESHFDLSEANPLAIVVGIEVTDARRIIKELRTVRCTVYLSTVYGVSFHDHNISKIGQRKAKAS